MSKFTTYVIYFLSLISAYIVYWLFSLFSSYGFISLLSFVAAALHFGISSWLFFFLTKSGRVFSITTGLLLIIWPIQVAVNSLIDKEYSLLLYYLIPVVFSLLTSSHHIINLTSQAVAGKFPKYVMAAIASFLFLSYVWEVAHESIHEGALNIVF